MIKFQGKSSHPIWKKERISQCDLDVQNRSLKLEKGTGIGFLLSTLKKRSTP